jgi:hypothetical protein
MTREDQIRLLGIASIAYHGLQAMVIFVIIPLFWGFSLLDPDPGVGATVNAVGTIIAVVIIALTIPGIIGGIGLLRRWKWSRYLVMIANALHILSFPLGTALGVFSFWLLTKPDVEAVLDN